MNYGVLSLSHEEKKRCPLCLSLNIKRNGTIKGNKKNKRGNVKVKTQRFFCKDCSKSFTNSGYNKRKHSTNNFKSEVVKDYVSTKSSLREIGYRHNISHQSILNWMCDCQTRIMPLSKVHKKLPTYYSGYISIDAKELKYGKIKHVIFTACDSHSFLPIYYEVHSSENKENTIAFLSRLKSLYPADIKGITSDFGRGKCFIGVVNKLFPETKHQICKVHFMRYINMFLPRTRRSEFYWRNKVLKIMIKRIVNAPDKTSSENWLIRFVNIIPFFRASYHKRFIRSIIVNYHALTTFYDDQNLRTNTNDIENINRQLERKFKNMDGIKSRKTLDAFLKLWFNYYYLKQHNDFDFKIQNWLKFCTNEQQLI